MFENLSERLERSFKLLKGQGKITELNVAETLLPSLRLSLCEKDGRNINMESESGCHSTRNAPLTFVELEPLAL